MQVQRLGYGVRGFYRIACLGHLWEMTPKDAQRPLQILRFFDKHGLVRTIDAFGVSRRTLYPWKVLLEATGGNLAALAAKSCAPIRCRRAKRDPRLVAHIRNLRRRHPNLDKDKLVVALAPWCAQQGIQLPSASTLGRITANAPDRMHFYPCRIDKRGKARAARSSLPWPCGQRRPRLC